MAQEDQELYKEQRELCTQVLRKQLQPRHLQWDTEWRQQTSASTTSTRSVPLSHPRALAFKEDEAEHLRVGMGLLVVS